MAFGKIKKKKKIFKNSFFIKNTFGRTFKKIKKNTKF